MVTCYTLPVLSSDAFMVQIFPIKAAELCRWLKQKRELNLAPSSPLTESDDKTRLVLRKFKNGTVLALIFQPPSAEQLIKKVVKAGANAAVLTCWMCFTHHV